MSAKYVIEGHNGRAYTIVEYRGVTAVYVYEGFLRGNTFILYPFRSLCYGERRNKTTIGLSEVSGRL